MTTDSVPIKDLYMAVKRLPDMEAHGFEVMVDGELTHAQFADLVAALIRHAVEKYDLPPMEVFDTIRQFYVSKPRDGNVVVVDFKRGN